jgi:diphthamide synthase subunit DPH2
VQNLKIELNQRGYEMVSIPQERPLSAGEVLGCTAPRVSGDADALIFVADGRFHLEAMMIANPGLKAFRCLMLLPCLSPLLGAFVDAVAKAKRPSRYAGIRQGITSDRI